METILIRLCSVSVQATIIFCVLMIVRGLFSLCRIPKKYAYILWIILFVRLILPVQLESAFGIMPHDSRIVKLLFGEWGETAAAPGSLEMQGAAAGSGNPNAEAWNPGTQGPAAGPWNLNAETWNSGTQGPAAGLWNLNAETWNPGVQGTAAGPWNLNVETWNPETRGTAVGFWNLKAGIRGMVFIGMEILKTGGTPPLIRILFAVWLGGAGALLAYGMISYHRLRRRVSCSIRADKAGKSCGGTGNIYLADDISTPFVMGLWAPRIYVPSTMEEENLSYVIAHEQTHVCRRDYLVKMVAFLIACCYWFHPIVWLSFLFMGRDMEMSCDEAVIGRLGTEKREAYADSLLRLTCGISYPAGAPLSFSEGDTKGRIRHIMKYKKPTALIAVVAGIVIVVLAAVLLASPKGTTGSDDATDRGTGTTGSDDATDRGTGTTGGDDATDRRTGTTDERLSGAAGDDADDSATGNETGERGGSNGSEKEGKSEIRSTVIVTQLQNVQPVVDRSAILGADGAILDYADEDIIIFHGYFGLYVYSVARGGVIGSVDLQAIGCDSTQGDHYCEVYVTKDGAAVYLHPLGMQELSSDTDQDGKEITKMRDIGYSYEVDGGKLCLMEYTVYGRNEENTSVLFREQIEEELSDGSLTKEGYLTSMDETIGNLVYIKENRQISLFNGESAGEGTTASRNDGAEVTDVYAMNMGGSTISYDNKTKVTIDGAEYDLADREPLINAITDVQYWNHMWIVAGHINPDVCSYSFYDTESDTWVKDISASFIAWDEGAAETDIRDTLLYNLYNEVYDYEDRLITQMQLEEGEYISGLSRQGELVTVWITSVYGEEGNQRELWFSMADPAKIGEHINRY